MKPGIIRQVDLRAMTALRGRCAAIFRRTGAGAKILVLLLALALMDAGLLRGQAAGTPNKAVTSAAPIHKRKTASSRANVAVTQPASQAAPLQAVAVPTAPPQPDWPANDQPSEATVTWDSHGLRVVAANSSLAQIMKAISTQTGATLDGLGKDQRVFGIYGPGSARDVISQLLDGSGYNVLMIGDQGQGTPRQIILTPQSSAAPATPNVGNQNTANEEENEADQQAQQPEPQPPPQQQLPGQPGMPPGVPMRSQQQIMEQMQERQREIQQQQQQQQNPQ